MSDMIRQLERLLGSRVINGAGEGGQGKVYNIAGGKKVVKVSVKSVEQDQSRMTREQKKKMNEKKDYETVRDKGVEVLLQSSGASNILQKGDLKVDNVVYEYQVQEKLDIGLNKLFEQMRAGGITDLEATEASTKVMQVLRLAKQVSEIHASGLNHRDIKPANIMIGSDYKDIHIIDFDSSRSYIDHKNQDSATTPLYEAPENSDVDHLDQSKFDVYSLGLVFLGILTEGDMQKELFDTEYAKRMRKYSEDNGIRIEDIPADVIRQISNETIKDVRESILDSIKNDEIVYSGISEEFVDEINTLLAGMLEQDPKRRIDINQVVEILKDIVNISEEYGDEIYDEIYNEMTAEELLFYGQLKSIGISEYEDIKKDFLKKTQELIKNIPETETRVHSILGAMLDSVKKGNFKDRFEINDANIKDMSAYYTITIERMFHEYNNLKRMHNNYTKREKFSKLNKKLRLDELYEGKESIKEEEVEEEVEEMNEKTKKIEKKKKRYLLKTYLREVEEYDVNLPNQKKLVVISFKTCKYDKDNGDLVGIVYPSYKMTNGRKIEEKEKQLIDTNKELFTNERHGYWNEYFSLLNMMIFKCDVEYVEKQIKELRDFTLQETDRKKIKNAFINCYFKYIDDNFSKDVADSLKTVLNRTMGGYDPKNTIDILDKALVELNEIKEKKEDLTGWITEFVDCVEKKKDLERDIAYLESKKNSKKEKELYNKRIEKLVNIEKVFFNKNKNIQNIEVLPKESELSRNLSDANSAVDEIGNNLNDKKEKEIVKVESQKLFKNNHKNHNLRLYAQSINSTPNRFY